MSKWTWTPIFLHSSREPAIIKLNKFLLPELTQLRRWMITKWWKLVTLSKRILNRSFNTSNISQTILDVTILLCKNLIYNWKHLKVGQTQMFTKCKKIRPDLESQPIAWRNLRMKDKGNLQYTIQREKWPCLIYSSTPRL